MKFLLNVNNAVDNLKGYYGNVGNVSKATYFCY